LVISGGVNIHPQETENLLITHPILKDRSWGEKDTRIVWGSGRQRGSTVS